MCWVDEPEYRKERDARFEEARRNILERKKLGLPTTPVISTESWVYNTMKENGEL